MNSSANASTMQVSGRRAARGTLQLMIGRMSFFALGYVVTVIIARELGPAEYGLYGIILSVLVWVEQIGRFGIPEASAKLMPEDEARASTIENTGQTLMIIIFLVLFGAFSAAASWLAALFGIPETAHLFRLAMIDIPVSAFFFAYQGILLGRRNFGVVGGGLVAYALAKLVGILIAVSIGLSIVGALIVNIAGTLGAVLYMATHISPTSFRPSLRQVDAVVRLAFPVGLYLLMLQILWNLDLWSLKIIGTNQDETVGLYVAALNVARMPALAFAVINGVILPSVSMALSRQDLVLARRYVLGAGRFLCVTLLPSCLLLAITAEELMLFLYSSRYADGAQLLSLQVLAFGLFGFAQVFSELLVARGNAYLAALAQLVHIPVALLLNYMLISTWGAIGAATALVLTAGLMALITGVLVWQRFGTPIEVDTVSKVLLATALVAVVATQVPAGGTWLLVEYLFLLGLYILSLVLLRELTWDDFQIFALWRREQV